MRAVKLRTARADEATVIAELWESGWRDAHSGHVPSALAEARTPESFRSRALDRIDEITVAEVNDAIAGFVIVVNDELEQLYVSAAHRGRGIADALLHEAERMIEANGNSTGWLAVVEGNARALAFYRRNGWRDEGNFEYAAAADSGTIPVPCRRYVKRLGATMHAGLEGDSARMHREASDPARADC